MAIWSQPWAVTAGRRSYAVEALEQREQRGEGEEADDHGQEIGSHRQSR
jgi:hypothetical protein